MPNFRFSALCLSALLLTSLTAGQALAGAKSHKTKPAAAQASGAAETVAYTQVGLANSAYQNFIHWDDKSHPLFYGVMDDLDHYNRYFQPAFVMGANKPAAPAAEVFQKDQFLVVARVVTAPAEGGSTFKVESLTVKNKVLELRYRYTPAEKVSTYSKSDGLVLQFAKQAITQAVLIENDKPAGKLNLQAGQWAVDASTPIPVPSPVPAPTPAASH